MQILKDTFLSRNPYWKCKISLYPFLQTCFQMHDLPKQLSKARFFQMSKFFPEWEGPGRNPGTIFIKIPQKKTPPEYVKNKSWLSDFFTHRKVNPVFNPFFFLVRFLADFAMSGPQGPVARPCWNLAMGRALPPSRTICAKFIIYDYIHIYIYIFIHTYVYIYNI